MWGPPHTRVCVGPHVNVSECKNMHVDACGYIFFVLEFEARSIWHLCSSSRNKFTLQSSNPTSDEISLNRAPCVKELSGCYNNHI